MKRLLFLTVLVVSPTFAQAGMGYGDPAGSALDAYTRVRSLQLQEQTMQLQEAELRRLQQLDAESIVSPSKRSLIDKLETLQAIKDRNLITQEEFEAQRKAVFDSFNR